MATITLNKDNFWQKMSLIYKELLNYNSIKLKIEKPEKKLLWTDYEEKSYLKWKKDFENWDVIDLSDLLEKYNFNELKKEYEKSL